MLQADFSVGYASLMEIPHPTHQLLEEESRQAFWERALVLQHVINSAHSGVLVHDAQRVIAQEYLQETHIVCFQGPQHHQQMTGLDRYNSQFPRHP